MNTLLALFFRLRSHHENSRGHWSTAETSDLPELNIDTIALLFAANKTLEASKERSWARGTLSMQLVYKSTTELIRGAHSSSELFMFNVVVAHSRVRASSILSLLGNQDDFHLDRSAGITSASRFRRPDTSKVVQYDCDAPSALRYFSSSSRSKSSRTASLLPSVYDVNRSGYHHALIFRLARQSQ